MSPRQILARVLPDHESDTDPRDSGYRCTAPAEPGYYGGSTPPWPGAFSRCFHSRPRKDAS